MSSVVRSEARPKRGGGVGDKWLCNETSLLKEWHKLTSFNVESYVHIESYSHVESHSHGEL